MDADFFKLDDGVREIGYTLLAGVVLALYVARALMRKAADDRHSLRRELLGRHLSLCVVALLAVASAAAIACLASPKMMDYAFREGGVFEAISAGSFLSVLLLAGSYWIFFEDRSVVNSGFILLGLGGFLDEISYGMRLFEFRPPIMGKIQIDGFHDLLEWTYRGESVAALASPAVLITALVALTGGLLLGAYCSVPGGSGTGSPGRLANAWPRRPSGTCLGFWRLDLSVARLILAHGRCQSGKSETSGLT